MIARVHGARIAHGSTTPPALRVLYAMGIVTAASLAATHVGALLLRVELAQLPALGLGVVLGVLLADWLSGVVHWACDTWGDSRTPLLGANVIHNFREHHRRPQAMLEHDWIDVNGEAATAAGVVFLGLGVVDDGWLARLPGMHAGLIAFLVFGAAANQIHQWAHMRAAPRPVRALQRCGLILSRTRHVAHHRAPHRVGYAIATGWTNPALDAIGYWRGLEAAITWLTGARPRRETR
jgi:ubiquitin-conjugating enzyme E2 variant